MTIYDSSRSKALKQVAVKQDLLKFIKYKTEMMNSSSLNKKATEGEKAVQEERVDIEVKIKRQDGREAGAAGQIERGVREQRASDEKDPR
jgi:hypothetical protein